MGKRELGKEAGCVWGGPDLSHPLPLQPSQLFTLGASEHSPLKTPYLDAGVSCAEQVGSRVRMRLGTVADIEVKD